MLFIITLLTLVLISVPAILERDNSGYADYMKNELGYKELNHYSELVKNNSEFAFSYKL